MKRVNTSTGFSCDIDETCIDDLELFDMIVEMEGGNAKMTPKVITKILGEEGKRALYDHVRDAQGRVPMGAAAAELTQIFEALGKK